MAGISQRWPALTGATVSLVGTVQGGGHALVREGDTEVRVALPPRLFALAAVLALHAKYQDGAGGGFVKKEAAAGFVAHATGVTPEDVEVNKVVFLLRKRLSGGDAEFGKRLVESQPYLGYRFSTAHGNVALEVTPDQPSSPGSEWRDG